jgi:hypothetical protein
MSVHGSTPSTVARRRGRGQNVDALQLDALVLMTANGQVACNHSATVVRSTTSRSTRSARTHERTCASSGPSSSRPSPSSESRTAADVVDAGHPGAVIAFVVFETQRFEAEHLTCRRRAWQRCGRLEVRYEHREPPWRRCSTVQRADRSCRQPRSGDHRSSPSDDLPAWRLESRRRRRQPTTASGIQ